MSRSRDISTRNFEVKNAKEKLSILPSSFGGSVLVTATISKKTTGSSLVGFDDAFFEFQLFDI